MSLPTPRGGRWRCVLLDPTAWPGRVALAEGPAVLATPGAGTLVKRTRTGWVQRLAAGGSAHFCKVYAYPTARDRRRGFFRNTWLARSRAHREAGALLWLCQQGFPAPRPVVVAELRRLGVVHAAMIVTEAVDGDPLDRVLPAMPADTQRGVLAALRAFVSELHRAGFRDRNLDLRNILLCGSPGAPQFVKIDSPRYRTTRAGAGNDRLARADWRRLATSLAELGLAWPP